MTLFVDPAGLTGLEGMATRAAEDMSTARAHFEKDGEIIWILDGVINQFQDDGDRIRQGVLALLQKAGQQTLPATADAFAYARTYYARTDEASAQRLDGTLPGGDPFAAGREVPVIAPGPGNLGLVRFQDMCEPTAHLGDVPYDDSAYGMNYKPKWHEVISPSAVLRNAIYQVTKLAAAIGMCDRAYDPFEVVLKPLCGDWVGMARVGLVLEQVSKCVMDCSSNLSWAAQSVPGVWSGNAADSAAVHLYQLTKALSGAAVTLEQIGAEYRTAAQAAFDIADTVGSLLHEIADAAILAAGAAATAGGSAATGVGLPVAALAAIFGAVEVSRVVSGVLEIIGYIGKLDALTATLKSAAGDFGEIEANHRLPDMPQLPAMPH